MDTTRDTGSSRHARIARLTTYCKTTIARGSVTALLLTLLATTPVAAQSTGQAFCNTQMAETIKNIFTLLQFGGPLLGGVLALGATITLPIAPNTERKLKLKELRNQAVIYGIIVAPLGTAIVAFLLNNVVVGGSSCGF